MSDGKPDLYRMDDHALATYALGQVRELGVRDAADKLGVSHGTVSNWRRKAQAGEPIEMETMSRVSIITSLDHIDPHSRSYADGLRHAANRLREQANELDALADSFGG